MNVRLQDLQYFVTLAEELHFTRAAERLFVSQPALSKQIRLLEEHLRVPLFHRDRRTVELTPAGGALVEPAREMIATWDAAQQTVADAAAAAESVLRIGFSTAIGRGLMPKIQEAFAELRPDWRVQLRQTDWDDPTGGLADRSSDLAFVWLPVPAGQRFSELVMSEESRHVALPAGHPLADRPAIAFEELINLPFLALPEEAGAARNHWLAIEERNGRPPLIGAVVANAEETFEAVLAGLGVVLISAGNARIYRRDGIVTRPVRGLAPSRLALIRRTDDRRDVVLDFERAARAAS